MAKGAYSINVTDYGNRLEEKSDHLRRQTGSVHCRVKRLGQLGGICSAARGPDAHLQLALRLPEGHRGDSGLPASGTLFSRAARQWKQTRRTQGGKG